MPAEFVAVPGSPYTDEDAALVGPELSRIAASCENPDKWLVVDLAKDPSSPLHSYIFKDTDRVAAHKWRGMLAGRLIRSILVRLPAPAGQEGQTVRAFEFVAKTAVEEPVEIPAGGVRPASSMRPIATGGCRRIVTVLTAVTDEQVAAEMVADLEATIAALRDKLRLIRTYPSLRARLGRAWNSLRRLFEDG